MAICLLDGVFDGCEGEAGSLEHIIPNAIGGRLSSNKLICRNCNSKSGNRWDAVLCNQFSSLCVFFGITRERGDVPNLLLKNKDGQQNVISPDGRFQPRKPEFSEQDINENEIKITVKSNNPKEAKKIIKSLCSKNKYKADISSIEYKETLCAKDGLDTTFSFDLAGAEVGRSIAKMMYLYSIEVGLEKDTAQNIYDYLSVSNAPQCFGPYYDEDIVVDRSDNIPTHIVSLCAKNNKVIGYVELFGLFKYIFNISDTYTNAELCESYCLDPVSGRELDVIIDYEKIEKEVKEYLAPDRTTFLKSEKWVDEKMPIFMSPWLNKNKERTLKLIQEEVLAEISSLEFLTEEDLESAIEAVMDKKFT
ncbi:HNH endonuclease [Pseudoalteromonas sp. XMcav1-K]|uniref:HNH endonuclease n=1 Tax=Pseudoalteromonas sp. XMcav1-K TaxID=3374372 RepID=UPI0037581D3F